MRVGGLSLLNAVLLIVTFFFILLIVTFFLVLLIVSFFFVLQILFILIHENTSLPAIFGADENSVFVLFTANDLLCKIIFQKKSCILQKDMVKYI